MSNPKGLGQVLSCEGRKDEQTDRRDAAQISTGTSETASAPTLVPVGATGLGGAFRDEFVKGFASELGKRCAQVTASMFILIAVVLLKLMILLL
jgi:hypothetical protein